MLLGAGVFSTYQSSDRVAEAQAMAGVGAFDLVIADEAHRCAGKVSTAYGGVLKDDRIRAAKRLFMVLSKARQLLVESQPIGAPLRGRVSSQLVGQCRKRGQ